jgi:Skp family chaperone for outer membrane proteins
MIIKRYQWVIITSLLLIICGGGILFLNKKKEDSLLDCTFNGISLAVIDRSRITHEVSSFNELNAFVQKTNEDIQKNIDHLRIKLENKQRKIQDELSKINMNEPGTSEKRLKIKKQKEKLDEYIAQLHRSIDQKRNFFQNQVKDANESIRIVFEKTIEDMCKTKNISILLDSSAVIYQRSVDITDDIIALMNNAPIPLNLTPIDFKEEEIS